MEIWLDSVDLALIEKANQMGILHGVTTNPTIVSQSAHNLEDLLSKILDLQKGPLAVQVTGKESGSMIVQGKALHAYSNRILVKISATGEGIKAIHALTGLKIPTMAADVFDQNQVLLAARAGAEYAAPCYSGICEADMNGSEALKAMLRLLHRYNYSSKILASSLKTPEHLKECSEMGTHGAAIDEKVFAELIEDHPMTLKSVNRFVKDWKKAKERKVLPF